MTRHINESFVWYRSRWRRRRQKLEEYRALKQTTNVCQPFRVHIQGKTHDSGA